MCSLRTSFPFLVPILASGDAPKGGGVRSLGLYKIQSMHDTGLRYFSSGSRVRKYLLDDLRRPNNKVIKIYMTFGTEPLAG